ncbi:hypothetical protein HD806DRAFT_409511 [Xylariaceae sp. AK1471]|nr:hypothetical protein HD806DRAFT_409511 [Xylariaceae sp. AK1471]
MASQPRTHTGKVDPDSKDRDGETPLWRAAANGRDAIVQLLLDTGEVDADLKDSDGWTLLSWAARDGQEALIRLTIRQPLISLRPDIKMDFTDQMNKSISVINMAKSAHLPREQTEGHIYFAKFCAFARTLTPEPTGDLASTETEKYSLVVKEFAFSHKRMYSMALALAV